MNSTSNSGTGVNSVSTSINNGVSGFNLTLAAGASATITVTAPQAVAGISFGAVRCNVWDPGSASPSNIPPNTGNPNQFTIAASPTAGTYLVQVFQVVTVNTNPAPGELYTTFMNPSVSPTISGANAYVINDSTLAILTGGGSSTNAMTVNVQITSNTR